MSLEELMKKSDDEVQRIIKNDISEIVHQEPDVKKAYIVQCSDNDLLHWLADICKGELREGHVFLTCSYLEFNRAVSTIVQECNNVFFTYITVLYENKWKAYTKDITPRYIMSGDILKGL